jgi:UDP-GlcNAc:undecaprenyl-phosphate GlcNAc-1-phosphate transferase
MTGKNPLRSADRKHLHHRLLDIGLGQRQTALIFYIFSIFFGLSGLFLQSRGKLLAVIILFLLMVALLVGLEVIENNRAKKSSS